jgi:hypothetical protein
VVVKEPNILLPEVLAPCEGLAGVLDKGIDASTFVELLRDQIVQRALMKVRGMEFRSKPVQVPQNCAGGLHELRTACHQQLKSAGQARVIVAE